MRPQATFLFFIFSQLFHFFTLLVALSYSSHLPTLPSFFLVQHLLNLLESVKGLFSSILTKALRSDRTDRPTDQRTEYAFYKVGWTLRHFKIFQNRRRVIAGTKKEVIRSQKAMLKIPII